jgi:hypothetical protein
MEVLYARCAGLDVHKESVSVCVLTPGEGAEPQREIDSTQPPPGHCESWPSG